MTRFVLPKGRSLKAVMSIPAAVAIMVVVCGCNGPAATDRLKPPPEGREFLTVNFQQGKTIRYRFVSRRQITRDWGATGELARRANAKPEKFYESMEMTVAYTPEKVDPYGSTTIKATVESISTKRSGGPGKQARETKDPVKFLAQRSFSFTVRPTGEMGNRQQLEQLIGEAGEKAFTTSGQGRIKEPDMIGDFIASQWFLWDPISSIENPIDGVAVGQSWQSKLWVPAPFVMFEARDVTYTLKEIRQERNGRVAVIEASYSHADKRPGDWPVPYTGSITQVRGRFGIFRNFRIKQLQGRGTVLFNLDTGTIEQFTEKYRMEVSASLLFPLPGTNPKFTIQQDLQMKLLKR